MGTDGLNEPHGSTLKARAKSPDEAAPKYCLDKTPLADSTGSDDEKKPRKTYGRVPDGSVFVVPLTHDMVSNLLSPTQPKNISDFLILSVLAAHIAALFLLPASLRTPVLLVSFLFWRTSYNLGIGYLLQIQSKHRRLTYWARKYGIFDQARHPRVYNLIKQEIETKIADEVKSGDYVFDKAPIEYNTWLVFRRLVDLILMCDFVSYVLFAISCAHAPASEPWPLTIGRWVGGVVLFLFNLWVKLDAHRVVKDYAWYWGDFFYLIDQNLTFDGVFEMAPHPMYSVGYAGYYGISLISASYTVLFTSLLAHAAQFAFLTIVENPHIDKTYNPPPVRRRSSNHASATSRPESLGVSEESPASAIEDTTVNDPGRALLGKMDLFHNTHFFTLLLLGYVTALSILTPNTKTVKALFVIHALAWRLWHSIGVGAILVGQSRDKIWVRHFLKYGETREEAWRQWKGLYHISLCMTHASFIAAAWKMYELPEGVEGLALFRHTVGILLIALQMWTATSIYESLGEFGWFYGDFFFEQTRPNLTYSGIYRFLNNPERLIGCAGIWGVVMISSSSSIFMLGLLAHICTLFFLQLVERPHMEKLYGKNIRKEAGVAKTIRKAIPPPVADHVRSFQGSIDKLLSQTTDVVEGFLDSARPKLKEGVLGVVKDTQDLISQYQAKLSITRLANDLEGYDTERYSVKIINAVEQNSSEGHKALSIAYGTAIRVAWTAPVNHSRKDWIGLYKITENVSRDATKIASLGRWVATCKDEYETEYGDSGIVTSNVKVVDPVDGKEIVKGEVVFKGDKTFWKNGVYEFRYHHDGKYHVMAMSQPFEITVEKFDFGVTDEHDGLGSYNGQHDDALQEQVEKALLPVVRSCFEEDENLAPETVTEGFGGFGEEKYAKRVVYAVKEMFGVDFAPEVVQADGNARKLAWRICNARKVLAPFSMSSSGSTTSAPPTPKKTLRTET
ncbi:phosphatidylethanolamine N-methyltransferase [Rhizina undulata]